MIVGRKYVQLAAIWHWYLPVRIYVLNKLYNHFCCCFCPLLPPSSDINQLDGMVDGTRCFFLFFNFCFVLCSKGNIENDLFENVSLMLVYVCFVSYLCRN